MLFELILPLKADITVEKEGADRVRGPAGS
jgi:hypothetical protein